MNTLKYKGFIGSVLSMKQVTFFGGNVIVRDKLFCLI